MGFTMKFNEASRNLQFVVKQNAAQHSVHPIPGKVRRGWRGGSRRVFRQFAWLGVTSDKMTLSRPAHQRVTPTVSLPNLDHSEEIGTIRR